MQKNAARENGDQVRVNPRRTSKESTRLGWSEAVASTAFHEAGHAVVSHLNDKLVLLASVRAREDSLGRILQEPLRGRQSPTCALGARERALAQVRVLLAGPAAEAQHRALYFGSEKLLERAVELFETTAAEQQDLREATRLAKALSFSNSEARHHTHFLHLRIAGMFATQPVIWHAVETVAVALIDHEELHGSHIHWLIQRSSNGRSYADLAEALETRIERGATGCCGGASMKLRRLST